MKKINIKITGSVAEGFVAVAKVMKVDGTKGVTVWAGETSEVVLENLLLYIKKEKLTLI